MAAEDGVAAGAALLALGARAGGWAYIKRQDLMGTYCGTKMYKRIREMIDDRGTGAVAGLALGGAVEGSTGAETRDRTAA